MSANNSAEVLETDSEEPARIQPQYAFELQTLVRPSHQYPRCSGASMVALNSGERAVVVEARPDEPDHPRVRVIRDADGKLLEEPYEVDLREAAPEERPITEVYLKPR